MLIDDLLKEVMQYKASDLHVSAGMPPILRVDGNLLKTKYPPFNPKGMEEHWSGGKALFRYSMETLY